MSINLIKDGEISLDKEADIAISKVIMGLGWDQIKPKGARFEGIASDVDLDASCLLFGEKDNVVDMVWFRQLVSLDGSVKHSGDNRTGEGDGDDEEITVDLNLVPDTVKSLVFVVNSFTGHDFSQVSNANCRIINADNQHELARFDLTTVGYHTAQIMAKIYRDNGEWKMRAIGAVGNGRTLNDLIPQISRHL